MMLSGKNADLTWELAPDGPHYPRIAGKGNEY
jgi:hypothetical protein